MSQDTDARTTATATAPAVEERGGDAARPPLRRSFTERHPGLGILLTLAVLLLVAVTVGQVLGHVLADLVQAALA